MTSFHESLNKHIMFLCSNALFAISIDAADTVKWYWSTLTLTELQKLFLFFVLFVSTLLRSFPVGTKKTTRTMIQTVDEFSDTRGLTRLK